MGITCKKMLVMLIVVIIALACAGCSGKKTMTIANVDEVANTFDLVDTGTRQKLVYERLIVNGNEVVDWLCIGMGGSNVVVLATKEGQIVSDGSKTSYSGQAYSTDAKLEYELKDGTLTIIDVQ